MERLLRRALEMKLRELDNYVHLRGLIEFGNTCEKNCLYCGHRRGNARVERYCLTDDEVLSCARLRVNGVVMNCDLWYDLFGVDRNCKLYLPKERRAYIW